MSCEAANDLTFHTWPCGLSVFMMFQSSFPNFSTELKKLKDSVVTQ